MAEAHSAVAFSLEVTHEGVDVNFDWEVLKLIWQSGIRSWKKRFIRFQNGVKAGVYPAPFYSLAVTCGMVSALRYSGYDVTCGLSEIFNKLLPGEDLATVIGSDALSGFCMWMGTIAAVRFTLKSLFKYKGWIYEERARGSKISLATRMWGYAVKLLSGTSPMLYSFQASLPALPLPRLHDTMTRYLRSVRPLLTDEEYSRMEHLTAEFEKGIGSKLQRYLFLKSWWSSNYVSDWWEEYVYLRGRSPIMVNSNFYAIDAILTRPTHIQTARAANAIHGCMLFRKEIEDQTLKPILVQGVVPLCSWQYERLFNTTRIPGIETDKLLHLHDSMHIVVFHDGRYFKLPLYHRRKLLSPADIEKQLERILENTSLPCKGEERLAALTASDRASWAKTRCEFFKRGINRISLDTIEKAAFVVVLDNGELEYDPSDPGKLDQFGRSLLHGKGCDRWFDKSFTLVVGTNGRIGLNGEHSWADAPIIGHLWEYVLATDIIDCGYRKNGHTFGEPQDDLPAPLRLTWEIPKSCVERIDLAYEMAQILLNDVDLRLYVHDNYGKGFMKCCKVSPDAYIQMALQLAYYRDAGKFNLTYEASMTRLYREGRTETVRPCTIESSAFVKSMENEEMDAAEKIRLLRKACAVHQQSYQNAMCGKGIDRHLFCLYVVSKYLEVDSPFLKEVLSEPWRLSTSQTPHGQTSKLDLRKYPNCISAGGGFGPVADDGYGVSYIIAGEDLIFFHVSSKKSSPETDSPRFARQIERSLADIRNLFQEVKGQSKM